MPPSGGVHLARGLHAPSGGVRLARGLHAPSGGVASLEGYTPPRSGPASLEGPPRARRPRSYSRVRAFNALTPQHCSTTLTRLGITPRHCSTDSLGKAIPATV
jgi:hypothetical protein